MPITFALLYFAAAVLVLLFVTQAALFAHVLVWTLLIGFVVALFEALLMLLGLSNWLLGGPKA